MFGEGQNEGAALRARTLRASASCEGVGLHTGRPVPLTITPAPAGTGIVFRRTDLIGGPPPTPPGLEGQAARIERITIKADPSSVVATTLGTVIGNAHGTTVSTVEHLMAAFAGSGIDHAIVEVHGPEVPIMDGSARPFLDMIERVGTRALPATRRAWRIDAPIRAQVGSAWAEVVPLGPDDAPGCPIDVTVDYNDRLIGRQTLSLDGSADAFRKSVAAARTFCYLADVKAMRAAGKALGGSLDNAIVVADGAVLNEEGLRFDGEFVRHKALDLIGDLHLLCRPVLGRVTAYKPGHGVNTALAAAIASSEGKTLVTMPADAEPGLRVLA